MDLTSIDTLSQFKYYCKSHLQIFFPLKHLGSL